MLERCGHSRVVDHHVEESVSGYEQHAAHSDFALAADTCDAPHRCSVLLTHRDTHCMRVALLGLNLDLVRIQCSEVVLKHFRDRRDTCRRESEG